MSTLRPGPSKSEDDLLSQAYGCLAGRLLAFATRLTGCGFDAEDQVQELWVRFDALIDGTDFATRRPVDMEALFRYLSACLVKRAANRRRREKRRQKVLRRRFGARPRRPEPRLIAKLDAERLLAQAPGTDAEVLRLRYLKGMTFEPGLFTSGVSFQEDCR